MPLIKNSLNFVKNHGSWFLPLLFLAFITPFTPSLDLMVSGFFYHPGAIGDARFSDNDFLDFIFDYAVVPAEGVSLGAALIYLLSYLIKPLKTWRMPALLLILSMIIGSGLITHAILKDHWGRPRPKQIISFGGDKPFRPYYSPNFKHEAEPSKSFPCGHCTMGFYFFTFCLIGHRYKMKSLTISGLFLGTSLGLLLSYARLAQGGHFFSDVLASALVMWLTAITMDWLIYSNPQKKT